VEELDMRAIVMLLVKFLEQPVYSRDFPPCRHC
jgi:hypothetical protein